MNFKLVCISLVFILSPITVYSADSCSALFGNQVVAEPHQDGPRSAADYMTPQTRSYKEMRNGVEVTTGILPYIHDAFKSYTKQDLERVLKDDEYAAKVISKIKGVPYTVEDILNPHYGLGFTEVRQHTAMLLSRMNTPNLVPGIPLSETQFRYQAGLLNGEIKDHKTAFRIDARDPNTVFKAGGFFPNPNKKPYTLWENVFKTIDGGANFVSATLSRGNPAAAVLLSPVYSQKIRMDNRDNRTTHRVKVLEIIEGTLKNNEAFANLSKERAQDLINQVTVILNSVPTDIAFLEINYHRGYEYRIKNVSGMETPDGYGNPSEKEIVTRGIPANQIQSARFLEYISIKIDQNGMGQSFPEIISSTATEWINLKND